MSVESGQVEPGASSLALRLSDDERGSGWVAFAGAMLMLLGIANIIEGIAAIGGSHAFATRAQYIVGNLGTWGWVLVVDGVVQLGTGCAVLFRNESARWLGVALAAFNAIVQLLFIQAYPFWSLALFVVDLLVIYGLVVHGGRNWRLNL